MLVFWLLSSEGEAFLHIFGQGVDEESLAPPKTERDPLASEKRRTLAPAYVAVLAPGSSGTHRKTE